MNLLAAMCAYAAISRELGLPLIWPGSDTWLTEATDARLLARAIAWAGGSPAATKEISNVTNGDVFDWQNLFPVLARVFGMETGAPHPMSLVAIMAEKAPVWRRIVGRCRLAALEPDAMIGTSWQFTDFAFSRPGQTASVLSTIKIRQAGVGDCIDSAELLE